MLLLFGERCCELDMLWDACCRGDVQRKRIIEGRLENCIGNQQVMNPTRHWSGLQDIGIWPSRQCMSILACRGLNRLEIFEGVWIIGFKNSRSDLVLISLLVLESKWVKSSLYPSLPVIPCEDRCLDPQTPPEVRLLRAPFTPPWEGMTGGCWKTKWFIKVIMTCFTAMFIALPGGSNPRWWNMSIWPDLCLNSEKSFFSHPFHHINIYIYTHTPEV